MPPFLAFAIRLEIVEQSIPFKHRIIHLKHLILYINDQKRTLFTTTPSCAIHVLIDFIIERTFL